MRIRRKASIYPILVHVILSMFALAAIVPLILVVIISLTPEKLFWTDGYSFFPKRFSFLAYKTVFQNPRQILDSYAVSLLVTSIGTLGSVWLTASLSYVLCRRKYALRSTISFLVFFTMIFNGGVVPSYILIASWLHLKDSLLALILPGMVVGFNVYLMRGYLQEIPNELIESAYIDGANELKIFTKIVLPIATPALATVGLLVAFTYWNNWMDSYLYIASDNKISLQFMLIKVIQHLQFLNSEFARSTLNLSSQEIPSDSARMAICILVAGPMMIVFPFFQKYFRKGLTVGAVKG